jgi:hypothetical protein
VLYPKSSLRLQFSSPLPVHSSLNPLWLVTKKTCTICGGVHVSSSLLLSPLWKNSPCQIARKPVPELRLLPAPRKIWTTFPILLVSVFFSAVIVATSLRSQPFFLGRTLTLRASSEWETFCKLGHSLKFFLPKISHDVGTLSTKQMFGNGT